MLIIFIIMMVMGMVVVVINNIQNKLSNSDDKCRVLISRSSESRFLYSVN